MQLTYTYTACRVPVQVVRDAKRRQAVVLTTHSMEEAEALCDRLGIFVDGHLRCIGNPQASVGRVWWSFGGDLLAMFL